MGFRRVDKRAPQTKPAKSMKGRTYTAPRVSPLLASYLSQTSHPSCKSSNAALSRLRRSEGCNTASDTSHSTRSRRHCTSHTTPHTPSRVIALLMQQRRIRLLIGLGRTATIIFWLAALRKSSCWAKGVGEFEGPRVVRSRGSRTCRVLSLQPREVERDRRCRPVHRLKAAPVESPP